MIHPHTELRYVSPAIGYGIYATQRIPKGTLTWVKDQLDRVFTHDEVKTLTPANTENLMKYSYRDRDGNFFFCWDLTRYVNHSFKPNSMLTAMGFEIAIKDIEIGEEITNDYGTLNIIEPFKCATGSYEEREYVRPDDLQKFYNRWDLEIEHALEYFNDYPQPLHAFLTLEQSEMLHKIKIGQMKIPSVIENYYSVKL